MIIMKQQFLFPPAGIESGRLAPSAGRNTYLSLIGLEPLAQFFIFFSISSQPTAKVF